MTTDRLFVILLVMLIPMTGCFGAIDNANGEEEETVNTPPVILGHGYFGYNTHYGDIEENRLSFTASAVDFDGIVTQFGLDMNLDGQIDFVFDSENHSTEYLVIDDNNSWWFDLTLYNEGQDLRNYCSQWSALLAIDDDGAIDTMPFEIITKLEWNDGVASCSYEPNNR